MGGHREEVGIDEFYMFWFCFFFYLNFLFYISVQKMLQFLKNKQINFVSMEYLKRSSSVAVIKNIYE